MPNHNQKNAETCLIPYAKHRVCICILCAAQEGTAASADNSPIYMTGAVSSALLCMDSNFFSKYWYITSIVPL